MIDYNSQVMQPEQAADFLGLSKSTLAKMRLSGNGPAYIKLGARRVGYLKEDLCGWIEARRFQSTTQYQ